MALPIPTYDFCHYKGDHWEGVASIILQNELGSVDLTGASIRMQLRTTPLAPASLEMSTDNGGITIINALSGEIGISGRIIDIPAHKYVYDLEYTIPSLGGPDYVVTMLKGMFKIVQDVTY